VLSQKPVKKYKMVMNLCLKVESGAKSSREKTNLFMD
jgi:hypothetical protein